jgi:signal transduction histidine kinase
LGLLLRLLRRSKARGQDDGAEKAEERAQLESGTVAHDFPLRYDRPESGGILPPNPRAGFALRDRLRAFIEEATTTAATSRARLRRFLRTALAALALSGGAAPALRAADAPPRRVLIITSFGSRFAPFETYGAALREAIVDGWPGPVEFLETPLEIARFEAPPEEDPLADYLRALVANRQLDLVVTIGAPAAEFVSRHRLFPTLPTLMAGLERRQLAEIPLQPSEVAVAVVYDAPRVIEDALHLFPGTTKLAVALGASPLERFWHRELEREFQPYLSREDFEWWDDLSLSDMRRRAAALGPGAAILYVSLKIDGASLPHEEGEGLSALRAVAKVPIFGGFTEQLGQGIVGGPLVPIKRDARRAADVALRLLDGESPARVAVAPPVPLVVAYDWRELRRFRVPLSILPAGSDVRFRPPGLWEAHREAVLLAAAVVLLQALLIAGLLAQRSRRRAAEARVHVLNRRLVHAQEEERKAIARELHDDFSQRLARIAMDVARLEYAAAVPVDGGKPPGDAMRDELTRLSEDAHALAYQLHPSTLEDLGLEEALRGEAERFSRLESVPVSLDVHDGGPSPSRETALCLFRVAQEGLRNVARHAKARSVTLSCAPSRGGLLLRLRDDGVGFEPERRRDHRPSLGLASMRERVENLGGHIAIRSEPGRGTEIAAWAPLEPRPE